MSGIQNRSLKTIVARLNPIAPVLSLVVLLLFPWYLGAHAVDELGIAARHAEVRDAIESVPEKLGNWVSKSEVAIPTGALNILRPNAYVSRRYQRIGAGRSVFATLMLIHCSDVRDMSGHYPPVCYPRSGWVPFPDRVVDAEIERDDGRDLVVRFYRFGRIGANGIEQMITVADTFILPQGESTVDMGVVINAAGKAQRSAKGVAQIQIYFEGDVPEEIAETMVGELLRSLPQSLIDVLMGTARTSEFGPEKEPGQ